MPSELQTNEDTTALQTMTGSTDILMDPVACDHLLRMAEIYSRTEVVPVAFRGKPNDIFVAAIMSRRLKVDLFMLLQNCYVVSGKVAFETKFALALLANSGKITGNIQYNLHIVDGKPACTASVIDAKTGDEITHTLTWKTVESEGWTRRNGSKWLTDPRLMLMYRSAIRLIRTHYPEVLLGCYSSDEAEEMNTIEVRPRSRREQAIPENLIGDLTSPAPAKKKLGRPRKNPDAPAPPMELVPAKQEETVVQEPQTDAAFECSMQLYLQQLERCSTEEEVCWLEAEALNDAMTPDEAVSEARMGRIVLAAKERRREL